MAITKGYITLLEYQNYHTDMGGDNVDDAVIERLIEAASRAIDIKTSRTFYERTETRSFDVPSGRELRLDDDLLAITTLSNGDGTTIADTEYNLRPANVTPKFAIKLTDITTVRWLSSSAGSYEQVIDVAGTWGYSVTAPEDIKLATKIIVKNAYDKREGQGVEGVAKVTAVGVILAPVGIPRMAAKMIKPYMKRL